MKNVFAAAALAAGILFAAPVFAGTTKPPNLTISKGDKVVKNVPIFDKWTNGATIAIGDLGTDGVPEVIVGAGPGSLPKILIMRQDGSLIRDFLAFDKSIAKGVIVSLADINDDGRTEIVAATGPKYGKFVRVFDAFGTLQKDWYQRPEEVASILSAASVPDEETRFSVPAPQFLSGHPEIKKQIIVSLSEQRLYAYEDGYLAATYLVSTGNRVYPTRTGDYAVMSKTPVKTYRGPGYVLPNTHWNTLFSKSGYFFHEAYWHNNFGQVMSHGCVNMRKDDAKFIYDWSEIGTPIIIKA